MIRRTGNRTRAILVGLGVLIGGGAAFAQQAQRAPTSYMPVAITDPFTSIMARMTAAKAGIEQAHNAVLSERYDLSNRAANSVTMSRGKPVQDGVRVKLPAGMTWEALAAMSPDEIRARNLYPKGFHPLPHPNHPEGGMLFPAFEIMELKKQEGRDLTRFDLDFDLPDHFLPEFPAPIYLTTRPDRRSPKLAG
jgi:cytochrome c peroxidase